jgi:hypothetical protein
MGAGVAALCGALAIPVEARAQYGRMSTPSSEYEPRDLTRNHFLFHASVGVMGTLPYSGSTLSPRAVATAQAGFGFSFVSWLAMGTHVRWHTAFADECVGFDWVGELAVRPPVSSWLQPFGYVQGGFGRFTVATPGLTDYGVLRLGGGALIAIGPVFNLELRGGAQQLLGHEGPEGNPFGLDASVGITLTEDRRPPPLCSAVSPVERARGACVNPDGPGDPATPLREKNPR